MKKHRKLITAIVVAVVLVAALTTVGVMAFTGEQATRQAGAAQTDAAAATPVAEAKTGRAVIAKGIVAPVQHAALSMAASGIVSEVLAKEGDQVTADQVILRLKNERQRSALAGGGRGAGQRAGAVGHPESGPAHAAGCGCPCHT